MADCKHIWMGSGVRGWLACVRCEMHTPNRGELDANNERERHRYFSQAKRTS